MRTFFPRLIFITSVTVCVLLDAELAPAAEKKDARITQMVREVRVLSSRTASRSASVNDVVGEGTAVRTGNESRAELTFRDQSLTRLGANTLFSFGPGSNHYDLTSGAMLLCVPKESGTAHITTAAVTAAVSGGIAMAEYHSKSWTKFIVIEGQAVLILRSTGQRLILLPGEVVALPPGAKAFSKRHDIDLKKLTQKSLLIRSSKLPAWAKSLVDSQVDKQQTLHQGKLEDPTGFDAIDQRAATEKPKPPPTKPPG